MRVMSGEIHARHFRNFAISRFLPRSPLLPFSSCLPFCPFRTLPRISYIRTFLHFRTFLHIFAHLGCDTIWQSLAFYHNGWHLGS